MLQSYIRRRLLNKTPVIISDNCWGGTIYNFFNLPYYSPLIGTYLYPDSFLKLLSDFPSNFLKPLSFTKSPRHPRREGEPEYYPVGVLNGDIEIYFLHYASEKEVLEKWERRTDRMMSVLNAKNEFFLKMDDSNFATKEDFEKFHSFEFGHKISFSKKRLINVPEHFEIKLKEDWVSGKNTSYNFDCNHWLNSGEAKQTLVNRITRRVFDSATYV